MTRKSPVGMECFVISPFGGRFDEYYREILVPTARSAGLGVTRADEVYGVHPIMDDIVKGILNSDVVIADVTGRNPNVNYELGMAHALGKPVVIISQSTEDIPFDYKHVRAILYDTTGANWGAKLKAQLLETLKAVVSSPGPVFLHKDLGDFFFYRRRIAASSLAVEIANGDSDPQFQDRLAKSIRDNDGPITMVGLGLAFIAAQNHKLTSLIKQQLDAKPELTVNLLLTSPADPGLKKRVKDEQQAQSDTGILHGWPVSFYAFLKREFASYPRVSVGRIPYFATCTVLEFDTQYYFRPYGPPNRGGKDCPWIIVDRSAEPPCLVEFLQNFIAFSVSSTIR